MVSIYFGALHPNIAEATEPPPVYVTLTVVDPVFGGIYYTGTFQQYASSSQQFKDSSIPIEAIGVSGFEFSRWTMAHSGTTNPDWLLMNWDKTLSADFVQVSKLQYQEEGVWKDVVESIPLKVYLGTTVKFRAIKFPSNVPWPVDRPLWAGNGGALGTGETKDVTFNTLSISPYPIDYKTVIVFCGQALKANVVVYELKDVFTPVDNFSNRSKTDYGLMEVVGIDHITDPYGVSVPVTWTKTGVGKFDDVKNVYTADGGVGSAIFTAEITSGLSKGKTQSFSKSIVAPSKTYMTQYPPPGVAHEVGFMSVGLVLYYWLEPKDVSFGNLWFAEKSVPATATSGVYAVTGDHEYAYFGAISGGALGTGCRVINEDHAFHIRRFKEGEDEDLVHGSFTWEIPNLYFNRFGISTEFYTTTHKSDLLIFGKAMQTKAGFERITDIDDPSVPFTCGHYEDWDGFFILY